MIKIIKKMILQLSKFIKLSNIISKVSNHAINTDFVGRILSKSGLYNFICFCNSAVPLCPKISTIRGPPVLCIPQQISRKIWPLQIAKVFYGHPLTYHPRKNEVGESQTGYGSRAIKRQVCKKILFCSKTCENGSTSNQNTPFHPIFNTNGFGPP